MRKTFSESLLPLGWSLCLFGDIVENHDGVRIPLKAEDRSQRQGGYPYYGASGIIDHIDDYLFDGDFLLIAEDGANLLARSSPAAFKASGRFWVNNHAHVIQPKSGVSLEWLHRFFEVLDLEPFVTGSAQPKLAQGNLNRILVPLPPLAEQQRIAAILDKADALRTKRRAALAKLDTLLQATFLHMFGDPVTNPMGWEVRQLAETFKTKPQIGSAKPAHEGGKQKIIRVGELGAFEVDLDNCKAVTLEGNDLKRFSVLPNDFLLARAIGSENLLGKSSIFQAVNFPVVYDSHVMRLRFDENILHPFFFSQWMKSKGGRYRFMEQAGRTAVQFNINTKQISAIKLALPPITKQTKFVVFFKKLFLWKERQIQSARNLDNLFHSLQQRAFKGEL